MHRKIRVAKLIEKIEGEATLSFHKEERGIGFVDIIFTQSRGIETILEGRPAEDALVINPRVCGICGHAHLIATVKALEACFERIELSPKAEIIRELTLNFELIQNHFKWFCLTLMPLLGMGQCISLAAEATRRMSQAIAYLAGQYPHNSYAIPGGVVSDPTVMDLLRIETILREVIALFEQEMVQTQSEELLACEKSERLFSHDGALPVLLRELAAREWHLLGKSYDRFIVFGESSYFKRGKSLKTRIQPHIDERYIATAANDISLARNVTYKNRYYETGPLSRAMLLKTPLIKDAHRRYGDSVTSRVIARSCESLQLLHHSLKLLKKIDLNEPSFIEPPIDMKKVTGEGVGAVEAARGSLVHRVSIENGVIKSYELITPTQWNLSQGSPENPGVSQKAMIGTPDETVAEFVFKTFDVCSVCTTH